MEMVGFAMATGGKDEFRVRGRRPHTHGAEARPCRRRQASIKRRDDGRGTASRNRPQNDDGYWTEGNHQGSGSTESPWLATAETERGDRAALGLGSGCGFSFGLGLRVVARRGFWTEVGLGEVPRYHQGLDGRSRANWGISILVRGILYNKGPGRSGEAKETTWVLQATIRASWLRLSRPLRCCG